MAPGEPTGRLPRVETIEQEVFTKILRQVYDPKTPVEVNEIGDKEWRALQASRGR